MLLDHYSFFTLPGPDINSIMFRAFHIEASQQMQLQQSDLSNAVGGALFAFTLEMGFIILILNYLFDWNNS